MCKGDSVGAIAAVTTVLDGGPSLCPSVRVRALLLAARASQSAAVCILTAALSIANYHYLDYLTALVAMQLAYVQVTATSLVFFFGSVKGKKPFLTVFYRSREKGNYTTIGHAQVSSAPNL